MGETDNPNKNNLNLITGRWIDAEMGIGSPADVIEKYRPKFVLWAQKRVKLIGGWPKEQNRTKVVKEFLARGFIHQSDAEHMPGKYPVITLIGELQWPVSFDHHGDALEFVHKFGISGYTKCPLPK